MPGDNWSGPLPLASPETTTTAERLKRDVQVLAGTIGFRNLHHPEAYRRAEDYLISELVRAGHTVELQRLDATFEGVRTQPANIIVTIPGTSRAEHVLVIGAHYDTFSRNGQETPGANDNASGCAALLELARRLRNTPQEVTLQFVLFANEEPPFFWTEHMGSLVHARSLKERGTHVVGMISRETMGVYTDAPDSQKY
ncbi:M28 family peptidase, partial [Synechococcus sp. Cruz CV-v-12]|nr:M28 family peptidase [Synechococcus sp. Cruz CV-v-12]